MNRSVRTRKRRSGSQRRVPSRSTASTDGPGRPVLNLEPVDGAGDDLVVADGPSSGAETPGQWSHRLARLLLRLPLLGRLEARLGPVIQRGRLDRADAMAGLIRYATMGVLATAVYFAVAIGLHQSGFDPNTTSAIAIVVSVIASFLMQSRVTFQTGGRDLMEAARFVVVGLIGLTVSRVTIDTVHLRAGQPFWVAALVVCLIVPIANFAAMNFWVFANARDTADT